MSSQRIEPQTKPCAQGFPLTAFQALFASLPSQTAIKSDSGIFFCRQNLANDKRNFILQSLLLSTRNNLSSPEEGKMGTPRNKSNKVAPMTPNGITKDDVDDLDLGHHRISLDNIETDEDRQKAIEMIKALPCHMAVKRKLL